MAKKAALAKPSQQLPEDALDSRSAFVRSVKLLGLGLDSVQATLNRSLLAEVSEREEIHVEAVIEPSIVANESEFFVVGVRLLLKQHGDKPETEFLTLDMAFTAKFGVPQAASKEQVCGFAELEARLVLFPYIRHFVSDLCFRMSIENILLPLTTTESK